MRILLSSMLILFSFTCVQTKATSPSGMDSIEFFIKDLQYEKALVLIDRLIQEGDRPNDLYYLKGNILRALFKYNQAIDSYLKALSMDTINNMVLVELANTYRLIPDYKNSLKYFSVALKHDSSNMMLQIECANCKYYLESFVPAITDFNKIYQNDTTNYFVIKRLAMCYAKISQNDSAINYYRKAIPLNPLDANNVINICNLLIIQKRYLEAIRYSEEYLALDSSNSFVKSQNAYLHLLNKNYLLSIGKFKNCLNDHDSSKFVFKNLGIAYTKLNEIRNFDTAKYYLERAYFMDTTDITTLNYLGISCTKSYYKKLGVYYLEKAAQQYSPQLDEYAVIYRNLVESCRTWTQCPCEKTLSVTLKAYELNPQDSILIFYVGFGYDHCKNDKQNAIAYYEKFLETKPAVNEHNITNSYNYELVESRLRELRKEDN
jgi:tetratricopeptide (TPR) repeat protein